MLVPGADNQGLGSGRRRAFGGSEEYNQGQVFGNVVETVFHACRHKNNAACANNLVFIRYPDRGTPGSDVIDFVLHVRLLPIFLTRP